MRRERRADPVAGPGELVRSGAARLLEVPAGTHALAASVRSALDRGEAPRPVFESDGGTEVLLVVCRAPESEFALPRVHAEPLQPLVAEFLALAERPLDRAGLTRFAQRHEIEPAELESVIKEFVAEGVLLEGRGTEDRVGRGGPDA